MISFQMSVYDENGFASNSCEAVSSVSLVYCFSLVSRVEL